jgi:hypothetical protein
VCCPGSIIFQKQVQAKGIRCTELQILPVSAVSSFDCWLLSQESP